MPLNESGHGRYFKTGRLGSKQADALEQDVKDALLSLQAVFISNCILSDALEEFRVTLMSYFPCSAFFSLPTLRWE